MWVRFGIVAWILGSLFLVLYVFVGVAPAEELPELDYNCIYCGYEKSVRERLKAGDWDELEAEAKRVRTTPKALGTDGRHYHGAFFAGLFWAVGDDGTLTYKEGLALGKRWSEAYPDSPTALMWRAEMLHSTAWTMRRKKHPPGAQAMVMQKFRELVEKTWRFLDTNRAVAHHDPRYYTLMMEICRDLALPEEKCKGLEKESFDAFPYNLDVHWLAMDRVLPNWGGTPEELERFARRLVTWSEADRGLELYARAYWEASNRYYGRTLFQETKVSWPDMRQGFDDLLAHHADAWNLNFAAKFACLAGDTETAGRWMKQMETQEVRPITQAWKNAAQFAKCRNAAEGKGHLGALFD